MDAGKSCVLQLNKYYINPDIVSPTIGSIDCTPDCPRYTSSLVSVCYSMLLTLLTLFLHLTPVVLEPVEVKSNALVTLPNMIGYEMAIL